MSVVARRFGLVSRLLGPAVALLFNAMLVTLLEAKPIELRDLTIAGDSLKARMVFNADSDFEPKVMLLRSPYRLVIDLPETRFRFHEEALRLHGLIRSIQYGPVGQSHSRIVVTAKGPFKVTDIDLIPDDDNTTKRFVLDVEASSQQSFENALAEQAGSTSSTTKSEMARQGNGAVVAGAKRLTVVIDPGHGGIDGGANGMSGIPEKEITLAFARELRDQLKRHPSLDVRLTRDGDTFLRLDERVRIARELSADIFISIHADTIRLQNIRGATVYTVSDRASDAESAALATRENLADQLSGIEIEDENHQIADILVDLIRRETHSFSVQFAKILVGELKQSVAMINNPHRMAGFRVLRAPDVPSVLLELGYLSNEADEKHLLDEEWRSKAASSIVDAVLRFAQTRPKKEIEP